MKAACPSDLSVLGTGGMGEVYLDQDTRLSRKIVVLVVGLTKIREISQNELTVFRARPSGVVKPCAFCESKAEDENDDEDEVLRKLGTFSNATSSYRKAL